MLPEYRTIYRGGEDEIVEKKSRFIATVVPVNTEEEALEFVEKTRKKYWDARHNCFAYIIGERGQLQRCSDDGEPNGTAGKPMLDVLLGNELRNVAVVVTRYFGGTLLGTGGLVRAYSGAVKAGLDASMVITKILGVKLHIETDYTTFGKIQYILAQRELKILDTVYTDKVELEEILEAIDRKENLTRLVEEMRDGISERIKAELLKEAQRLSETELEQFSRKIRIYYVLSCFEEKYMDSCFATISSGILAGAVKGLSYDADAKMGKDQVTVNLPVRVNWGGGWSDTPPYCMEHGGTVLNAAVMLDGNCPIEVVVKKVDEPVIVLASADSGAEQTFTDISSLQDSSNPYDPFALHKAALIACGVIPYKEPVSVQEITKNLGSGLYLSTQVINIPRGSGLGTSSILAGACVKALYEMLGKEVTDEELYDRVLCMEQIMSTGGGWQDQVGGLAPGIKMVSSEPAIRQRITCVPCKISEKTRKELDERFCLIYSGQRRLARNLLRDVVGRYVGGIEDAVDVLYEIQQTAVLMRFELEKGNIDGFAELLNQHWELSKKLDAGCTNTCIDMIFHSVEDLIDGKMICGAGGGGFLQVVLKKGVTQEDVRKRLREVFQDSGVDVWSCSLA